MSRICRRRAIETCPALLLNKSKPGEHLQHEQHGLGPKSPPVQREAFGPYPDMDPGRPTATAPLMRGGKARLDGSPAPDSHIAVDNRKTGQMNEVAHIAVEIRGTRRVAHVDNRAGGFVGVTCIVAVDHMDNPLLLD